MTSEVRAVDERGVVFCDMRTARSEHSDLIDRYFGTALPASDTELPERSVDARPGGAFIYVPPGVKVELPLEAFSRTDATPIDQFERTLLIADEGSTVHYIDGCSAPRYTAHPTHAAVVEIIVQDSARVSYTATQNWSLNVHNAARRRARVAANGHIEWIDATLGSNRTVRGPAVDLVGNGATCNVLSVAYAGLGQRQDVGVEVRHEAAGTVSTIVSKSISNGGEISNSAAVVHVADGANGVRSNVAYDVLSLGANETADVGPISVLGASGGRIDHSTTVTSIADEQRFYLMSRGLSSQQAVAAVVNGFIAPVTASLPIEYAVEWSRLVDLQVAGAVG
ncbi:MAG: SufD family Fe-S cluster assembly protein [Ilumatobacter sp.]